MGVSPDSLLGAIGEDRFGLLPARPIMGEPSPALRRQAIQTVGGRPGCSIRLTRPWRRAVNYEQVASPGAASCVTRRCVFLASAAFIPHLRAKAPFHVQE